MEKYDFAMMVFLISAAYSLWGGEPNLASNDPGMEQGTKYFYFMTPKEYSSFAKEGVDNSMALKIQNSKAAPARRGGLYRKSFIPVNGGRTYTFKVDCKSDLTSGYASARINAFKKGEGGKNTYLKTFETSRISGKSGKWERLQSTFTMPKNADILHFELSARDFTGTVLFDNVSLTEGVGAFKLPLLKNAPRMDGKWDSQFAGEALHLRDFLAFPVHDDASAPEETEVFIAQTDDTIYGVFLLHHPAERKLKASVKKNDGPLWEDDSVELFITQTNSARPYYHFIMNTAGSVFDALEINDKWNSGMKTAAGRLNDTCDFIQFALPLSSIGYNAELDAHLHKLEWKMNFTRSHSYDSRNMKYSTFAKVIGFHNPDGFLPFEGLTGGKSDTVSVRYFNQGIAENSGKIKQQRYWKVNKPLYRELLSDTPNPLKGESAFIWPRPIEKNNTEFAIQYGQVYTQEMMLDEYQKNRLHPYGSEYLKELSDWGKKSGVGLALYSPYYMNNYSFIYNLENRKKYLEEVRSILEKYHEGIWAVSLGDEVAAQVLRRFVKRANNPEELKKDPALRQAVDDIREKYGFGKYSVPKNVNSEEPFAWNALRRWAFNHILETQKELYKLCAGYKGVNGQPIRIIGSDHVDWGLMQYQSRFGKWQDIATAQILPANDPQRQVIAFRAKLLKDLTGNSVWLCLHVEPYAGNYTSEETAAFISEAVRGGGSGLQIWNYDFRAGQRNMGSSQFDYYGHRPRWNTIMDCVRRMREDNLAKYPRDDFAILVSNDTAFSHPKMKVPQYEAAFNLMGPGVGAWFKFISDTQLLDNTVSLDRWKLLVLPKGTIISAVIAEKLEAFVKKGGILLCFDPDFMEYDISGKNTSALREQLFGVRTCKSQTGYATMRFNGKAPFAGAGKEALPASGANRWLDPRTAVETLAVFPDGKSAVAMKKYPNGGRAILSAVELQFYQSASPAWRKVFHSLLSSCGVKTDHAIWNFMYPHKTEEEPAFKSKCLTGNNFYWWNNEVRAPANATLPKAYYTYTIAPDNSGNILKYSFAEGRLTNRLKAPFTGDLANFKGNRALIKSGKLHRGLFADTWSDTRALEIKFHTGSMVAIDKVVLFWHGELPAGTTVSADDGKTYPLRGGRTDGVLKTTAVLPSLKTKTLTVRIPARAGKLTLSEIEIWGSH